MSVFCQAQRTTTDPGDAEFETVLAECTRRWDHSGHHCDRDSRHAWDESGPLDCPNGYDHGQPPNRAARRGNVTHPQRSDLVRKVIKGGRR